MKRRRETFCKYELCVYGALPYSRLLFDSLFLKIDFAS